MNQLPFLEIRITEKMGRGVFTVEKITKNTVIEIAPVIVMSLADRQLLDQTALYNYIFEWGYKNEQCCMALGWVPIYNHSYKSNCEYEMDYENSIMHIIAVQDIQPNEELFINYNGDWDNDKPLWFDTK